MNIHCLMSQRICMYLYRDIRDVIIQRIYLCCDIRDVTMTLWIKAI